MGIYMKHIDVHSRAVYYLKLYFKIIACISVFPFPHYEFSIFLSVAKLLSNFLFQSIFMYQTRNYKPFFFPARPCTF